MPDDLSSLTLPPISRLASKTFTCGSEKKNYCSANSKTKYEMLIRPKKNNYIGLPFIFDLKNKDSMAKK